ncbi:MAG: hypothetical protein CM1200mP12_09430 [Gammaproteobacteria bacterium]|nr:MAG: hypothetical protein CM1200mP12_09430 [Gammaproteobacteria bacterium]
MTRSVLCKKFKRNSGLDQPPYPGPKGQEILKMFSKQAWEEWLDHQKMLINEGQLTLRIKRLGSG